MFRALFFGVCLLGFTAFTAAADPNELVKSTVATHEQTLQKIKTLSVRVQRESKSDDTVKTEVGEYHRSGSTIRISTGKTGSRLNDILVKDGVTKQVVRTKRDSEVRYGLFTRASNKALLTQFNLSQELAFEIFDPKAMLMRSVGDFFEQPGFVTGAASVTLNGRKCVRVDCDMLPARPGKAKASYWFDLGYGGLVAKITIEESFGENPISGEKLFSGFTEYEPGLCFPNSVILKLKTKGEVISEENYKLSNIKINQPIAESVFALPAIPAGSTLQNDLNGKLEEVDSDWKPLRPGVPLKLSPIGQPAQPAKPIDPAK